MKAVWCGSAQKASCLQAETGGGQEDVCMDPESVRGTFHPGLVSGGLGLGRQMDAAFRLLVAGHEVERHLLTIALL